MDDSERILSILPGLSIQPLVEKCWVSAAIARVAAGDFSQSELEDLFVRLGILYLNEKAYSGRLQEENADLSARIDTALFPD